MAAAARWWDGPRPSRCSAVRLLTAFFLALPALCYYFITARSPSLVTVQPPRLRSLSAVRLLTTRGPLLLT
jgi:hypothetical protein